MKNALHGACIALLLSMSTSCSHAGAGSAPQSFPPPRVEFEVAAQQPVTDEAELTGRIAATDVVEVRPRISGHIQEVRFHAGQTVEKDQVLFVIDPRWHQAEFARQSALLQSANARLGVAEKEFSRAQSLEQSRAISAEELGARSARVLEARAAVAGATASDASAKLDLEFTEIRSPIKGRVSRPFVTTGNYVSGVAGMTTVMTTVVSIDPVHFYSDLDESTFLRFRAIWETAKQNGGHVPLRLALSDEKEYRHQGEVESLDNQVDVKSGTMLMRGSFANQDGVLVPGLYARVSLPLGAARAATLVAERAIRTDQNQKYVHVIGADSKVEYRVVTLGIALGNRREVRTGVKPGERVIVAGQSPMVRPGALVTAVPAAQDSAVPKER